MLRRTKQLVIVMLLALIATSVVWQHQAWGQSSDAPWPAEAFRAQWQRTDAIVAAGGGSYSWYWGPTARSAALFERNDDAPGGKQLVVYYDKGRMELPVQFADAKAARQLSFGRLVAEMVTGNVQLGNQRFDPGSPAAIPVAGDGDDPLAPTYASFARVASTNGTTAVPRARGQRPQQAIDRTGAITTRADLAQAYPETAYDDYDAGTGHNISGVFSSFMRRTGPVNTPNGRSTEQLIDPLAVIGRPMSEAYWAEIEIDNRLQPVLIQLFERRVLTYTPGNPQAFRVEMGNVGLHYFKWRYTSAQPRTTRREEVVAHFENGDQALNGNYWFSFDDRNNGGSSTASNFLIDPGVEGSVRAMRFQYSVTEGVEVGFAALAVSLGLGGNPIDLNGYTGIGFWARGDAGRYSLQLSSALADEPFAATFAAGPDWTWVEVPLQSLQQPPSKATVEQARGLGSATRLAFRPSFKPSAGFLDIDNLVFIRGEIAPSVAPGLPLLDDFEDGTLISTLNTEWFGYTDKPDGGSSQLELALDSPGFNNSRAALRIRGSLENKLGPAYLGFGVPLTGEGQTFDMSEYEAIEIAVKTDGNKYRLQLSSALIDDGNQYGLDIVAPAGEWTPLYIPIKLLTPADDKNEPRVSLHLALTQLTNIIITPLDQPEAFQLVLDDVRLVQ